MVDPGTVYVFTAWSVAMRCLASTGMQAAPASHREASATVRPLIPGLGRYGPAQQAWTLATPPLLEPQPRRGTPLWPGSLSFHLPSLWAAIPASNVDPRKPTPRMGMRTYATKLSAIVHPMGGHASKDSTPEHASVGIAVTRTIALYEYRPSSTGYTSVAAADHREDCATKPVHTVVVSHCVCASAATWHMSQHRYPRGMRHGCMLNAIGIWALPRLSRPADTSCLRHLLATSLVWPLHACTGTTPQCWMHATFCLHRVDRYTPAMRTRGTCSQIAARSASPLDRHSTRSSHSHDCPTSAAW